MSGDALLTKAYDWLTDDEDARVCKDIPDAACNDQPKNYFIHLASLSLTKTGDKFADPKIVIAWLLTALGAPSVFLSLLVPIRESLSLLPQMIVAGVIRRLPVRKWLWSAGSLGQALALAAMGFVALSLSGARAGAAIVAALTVFSLSRGICSVTHKDVVGKTISKTRRGGVSGYADAVSGAAAALLALWFILGGERSVGALAAMSFAAAAMWVAAAVLYAQLSETAGATEGGGDALAEARRQIGVLKSDRPFRRFVFARTALLGSALAAPYYVALARNNGGGAASTFGALLLAASVATFLTGPFWGRMSDRSSRKVMTISGAMAGVAGLGLAAADMSGWRHPLIYVGALFLLYAAHTGVRNGRKTHIVDIATADTRAAYVAVSNTIIGAALAMSAAVGWAVSLLGDYAALLFFSACALIGAILSWRLTEAQAR